MARRNSNKVLEQLAGQTGKHEIAIVSTKTVSVQYGDDYETFVAGITEWSTVSTEELNLLRKYCDSRYGHGTYNYMLIERLDKIENFLPKTIQHFRILAEKEAEQARLLAEKAEAERVLKEQQKRDRILRKQLKEKEDRERLFNQLKQEFEK